MKANKKFLYNEQGDLILVNAGIFLVALLVVLYTAVLITGIMNDISHMITTAGSLLIVLTPLLILLYLFRREEKRKRTWILPEQRTWRQE